MTPGVNPTITSYIAIKIYNATSRWVLKTKIFSSTMKRYTYVAYYNAGVVVVIPKS
jgi:hypothetical protein